MLLKAFTAALTLAFLSCNQTPKAGAEQERYYKRMNEELDKKQNATNVTPVVKKKVYIPFWDRIEGYINTSSKEDNPILLEIEERGMGRGYMHSVVNLWMHVQFNIKNGLSKGVVGINDKNFNEQYTYQTELARANGYGK